MEEKALLLHHFISQTPGSLLVTWRSLRPEWCTWAFLKYIGHCWNTQRGFEEGKYGYQSALNFYILFSIHAHQLAIFREQITLFEFLHKRISHEGQDCVLLSCVNRLNKPLSTWSPLDLPPALLLVHPRAHHNICEQGKYFRELEVVVQCIIVLPTLSPAWSSHVIFPLSGPVGLTKGLHLGMEGLPFWHQSTWKMLVAYHICLGVKNPLANGCSARSSASPALFFSSAFSWHGMIGISPNLCMLQKYSVPWISFKRICWQALHQAHKIQT